MAHSIVQCYDRVAGHETWSHTHSVTDIKTAIATVFTIFIISSFQYFHFVQGKKSIKIITLSEYQNCILKCFQEAWTAELFLKTYIKCPGYFKVSNVSTNGNYSTRITHKCPRDG